jgi:hypothetical protein
LYAVPDVASEIFRGDDHVAPRFVDERYQMFQRPSRCSPNHVLTTPSPEPAAAGNAAFAPLEIAVRALHVAPASDDDRAYTVRAPPGVVAPL